MSEIHYRIRQPKPDLDMITAAEIAEWKFHRVRVSKPRCDRTPSIIKYCENSSCPVREVTVDLKLHDSPRVPVLNCPACGKRLKHHGYEEHETLEPVPA